MAERVWSEKDLVRCANRRPAVLRHAEEVSGSVAATCRYFVASVVVVALTAVVFLAVRNGAETIAVREQPYAALSATVDASGVLTLTVKANASSLRSSDDMLVQVIGLKDVGDLNNVMAMCRRSHWRPPPAASPVSAATDDLLVWQQFGPDPKGNVSVELSTQVLRTNYGGACALAVLRSNRGDGPDDARSTAAYLQLTELPSVNSAVVLPIPAATTPASDRGLGRG